MDMTGYGLLSSGRHSVDRQECESLGYTREELIGNAPLAFHMDSIRCGCTRSAASYELPGPTSTHGLTP
jgi:hypothetical protein